MPSEPSPDVKFEIGHVLFIDIVGYSKLLIHEQSEQMQTLREIVRGTEQFRAADAEGKLLRLPTGDGGALVFRTSPEAPVRCALEISKELKKHPELRVRMGIHSGAVNEITDLNANRRTSRAPASTSHSGSWIAVMRATFFSPGMLPKIWSNIGSGSRTCTISESVK